MPIQFPKVPKDLKIRGLMLYHEDASSKTTKEKVEYLQAYGVACGLQNINLIHGIWPCLTSSYSSNAQTPSRMSILVRRGD